MVTADGAPAAKRWWVWSVTREDAVVYRILESRLQQAARDVLGAFTRIVTAGGYGAFDALARAGPGPGITLAHRWAHARRRFEAAPHYPELCRVVLDIGQLYVVERAVSVRPAATGGR